MTPIGLLTKSNSIRGMTERVPGYRMTKFALPKFGAPARVTGLRVEMEPEQQPLLVPMKIAAAKPVLEEPVALKKVEVEEIQVLDVPVSASAAAPDTVDTKISSPKPRRNWLPKINLPKFNFRQWLAVFKLPKRAPKVVRFVREEEIVPAPPESIAEVAPVATIALVAPVTPAAPPAPVAVPAPITQPSVAPVLVKQKSRSNTWDLLLRRITFRRRVVKVAGVQTELALERVSPVRNDLSDADLEVIPRMDTKKREANPFRNGSKAGRVKKAREETNTAPPMVPLGAMAAEPTE